MLFRSASGLSVMYEIVARIAPGARPSLSWLDYVRHDAPVRRAFRAALARGAEAAWLEIESAALKREELIWIVQGLNVRNRTSDGLWLHERVDAKGAGAEVGA